jgi:hypothetical protein
VPAPAPASPQVFKRALEIYGFELVEEDEFNWGLFKADENPPVVVIPKEGEMVSLTIMMAVLDRLKMNNAQYFDLIAQAEADLHR